MIIPSGGRIYEESLRKKSNQSTPLGSCVRQTIQLLVGEPLGAFSRGGVDVSETALHTPITKPPQRKRGFSLIISALDDGTYRAMGHGSGCQIITRHATRSLSAAVIAALTELGHLDELRADLAEARDLRQAKAELEHQIHKRVRAQGCGVAAHCDAARLEPASVEDCAAHIAQVLDLLGIAEEDDQ